MHLGNKYLMKVSDSYRNGLDRCTKNGVITFIQLSNTNIFVKYTVVLASFILDIKSFES